MNNECNIGKKSLLLSSKDVQKIIADRFKVSPDNVFKSQYSYTVVLDHEPAPVVPEVVVPEESEGE